MAVHSIEETFPKFFIASQTFKSSSSWRLVMTSSASGLAKSLLAESRRYFLTAINSSAPK